MFAGGGDEGGGAIGGDGDELVHAVTMSASLASVTN
jgi:hypothetical protein